MTQTPDIWMETVNEPVEFENNGESCVDYTNETTRDHYAEGIKITEQLIAWIYSSLIPDVKKKETVLNFYDYNSLLDYSKAVSFFYHD